MIVLASCELPIARGIDDRTFRRYTDRVRRRETIPLWWISRPSGVTYRAVVILSAPVVGQVVDALDDALAERLRSNDGRRMIILQRAGGDLRCTRGVFVDQHDERLQPDRAPVCRAFVLVAVAIDRRDDRALRDRQGSRRRPRRPDSRRRCCAGRGCSLCTPRFFPSTNAVRTPRPTSRRNRPGARS